MLRWLEETTSPLLLALDDLHWADPDSLALLSFLCRRLAGLPVAVLGTLRPWPPAARELVNALVHDGDASMLRLAPLSVDAATRLLISRLGGAVTESVVHRAAALCAGNPLLLEQVAASLGQRGQPDGLMAVDKEVGAEGIVLARFAGLPSEALDAARAASVLGLGFARQWPRRWPGWRSGRLRRHCRRCAVAGWCGRRPPRWLRLCIRCSGRAFTTMWQRRCGPGCTPAPWRVV